MTNTPRPALALVLLFVIATLALPAEASVNAFWKELGGSATGGGVSQLTPTQFTGNGVAVAAGADGKPVVVYTVSPFSEDGTLLAKRWTGTAWQLISPATGINDPSIGGENPQMVISPAGTIFVAWNTREAGGGQIHLRRRTATGTVWEQLGGSDSPGGLTSLSGSSLNEFFSLAVGDDDLPVVAFTAPVRRAGLGAPNTEMAAGQTQIYVKKYMGAAQGWQYLGSDPFGTGNTDAGGASGALSFLVAGGIYATHAAIRPSLVIDSEGRPTVAFAYQTFYFSPPGPPEFIPGNTEIFVTRFDNGAWAPVGPAVPVGDTVAGRGGAGGVSAGAASSDSVSLAAASGGVLWIAWQESSAGTSAIYLRRWNGVDTWEEVGGASASGGGISGGASHFLPRVGLDETDLPIVIWLSGSEIFALRFDGSEWAEMGPDSASGDGITGPFVLRPALAVSSGSPSTVNVAWIGSTASSPSQARLRQFFNGPSLLLSVGIVPPNTGRVVSSPIGIDCPADSCSEFYPSGTVVNLTAIAGPDSLFDKWTGACIGSAACNVAMTAARSLNASFVPAATLTVVKSGLGTVTGTGIACGADCDQKYRVGTLVTLTATMPVGTLFDGWGGACAFRGTNVSCPLTLNGNQSVSAQFHQRKYRLNLNVTAATGTLLNGSGGHVLGVAGPALDCGVSGSGTCSADVDHGTRVILQSVPQTGNRFASYAGTICNGRTNATCDFTMLANGSTNALFAGITTITVAKSGNAAAKALVTGPGISCGADCTGAIDTGTKASLTLAPGIGSHVTSWGGACTGFSGPTCTFTAQNVTQTATVDVVLNRHHLQVTGEGFGYTQSNVPGIDCGSVPGHFDCDEDYDYGTTVALTPFPGTDSMFSSWTGCSRLNGSVCFVDMTTNHTVHKVFKPARTLSLGASGNGHGKLLVPGKPPISCTGCAGSFLLPFTPTAPTLITATPDTGSNFQWVAGTVSSCIGKSTPCSVIMSTNQSLTGVFALNRHSMIVTNRANGSVTGTFAAPDPFDVFCGSGDSQCTTVQNYGTPVQLLATPDVGNVFVNWTGTSPCSVGAQATNPLCSFPLQGNVTVTPNFRARTLLTVFKAGSGLGTITGPGINCGADCTEAEFDSKLVTLTAAPAVGSSFGGFTGACVSSTSICPFIPTGNNQSVTATFALRQFQVSVGSNPAGHVSNPFALPDDISCGRFGADCSATLDYNTPVLLVAEPDDDHVFAKWTGTVCSGSTNSSCSFKIGLANVSVTPSYRLRTHVIVMKDGPGRGVVTSTPPTLNCPATVTSNCEADFFDGTPVTLRATPATGSRFLGFSDQCTSANATCTFNPSGPTQFVHAEFQLLQFTLNVTSRNQGTVSSFPGSIDCGAGSATPCSAPFDYGTSLQLTAFPEPGFIFVNWTGVTCTLGNTHDTCAFTLTANTTATPNYRRATVVQVQRDGEGNGTVTGLGFACGADCQETIFDGKSLSLTATAAVGSKLTSWSAPCAGSNASVCTFTPVGDQQIVTATFDRLPVSLTVNVNGSGAANGVAPPCTGGTSPCVYSKLYGDQVVLQAAANPGARFISWTGCTTVAGTNCTVLLNGSKTVTVSFQPEFALVVTPSGNSTGTITGTGINCGVDCSETYLGGTVVTLTRSTPATGASFLWLGDCAFRGTNSTCVLTMNQNHSVFAQYQLQQFTVTVNKTGTAQGRVLGLGVPCDLADATCSNTFDYGTQVVLTSDVTGTTSIFDGWGGACTGTGSCNLSVTTSRTVTAGFSPTPSATVTVGPGVLRTFASPTVTITAGQTVRWEWASANHNVVSGSSAVADGQFCSPADTNCAATPLSGPGTVYSHTFATPGTYSYFCRQHATSGMTGTVVVNPPE